MADDLLERVRATGLLPRAPPSSCCSPAGATRSACSTSPCALGCGGRARCTSTTGCARRPTATRRTAARCASGLGVELVVAPRDAARRRDRQPPGVGARRPLRAPRRAGRGRRRSSPSGTPRPTRPRRSSTGWPRRRGAARCSAWRRARAGSCGRCSASRARRRRRGARRAACAWREDATNAVRRVRARARAPRARCRRCEASTRRGRGNVVRTAQLLRDEAEVLDVVVDDRAGRPRPDRARAPARRCRRRSRGSSCGGWPRARPARCARAPPTRVDDILALGDAGALDVGDGARAVVEGGVLRFEGTPPLPVRPA